MRLTKIIRLTESLLNSEEKRLRYVSHDGRNILHIENPSEAVQLAAIKQDPFVIGAIKNPSEQICLFAVSNNGFAIKGIDHPSEAVQLMAVTRVGSAIKYIKHPSQLVLITALKQKPFMRSYGYEPFVREYFKDNVLLMKKWLRYGETMRNQE